MGIVINGGFAQMMDFMAGFMGFDPAGDDGYKYGRWPWQTTRRMVRPGTGIEGAAPAREQPAPSTTPTTTPGTTPGPKAGEPKKGDPKGDTKPKAGPEAGPQSTLQPRSTPVTDQPTSGRSGNRRAAAQGLTHDPVRELTVQH